MAKTNISIWHRANGEIVAIGRAVGKHKATPIAGPNQFIFEAEIEEAHIKGLSRTHRVDMQTKTLVKHTK